MPKFTKIPQNTFDALQLDAGVLLSNFDPETANEPADEDIICATTGGITITATADKSDMGEDVDNCPTGMMELMKINSWTCSIGFTAITLTPKMIKLGLGAADIAGQKITIRRDLQLSDFEDIWWVGDTVADGMVAVHLLNALSADGLTITTSKNGKGGMEMTLQGHVSINDQDTMPMEFYSTAGSSAE